MKTERRSALKKIFASVAGIAGFGIVAKANAPEEKTVSEVVTFQEVPLISRSTKYGNLLFLTGRGGYGAEPFTIENHTKVALDLIEEELINRGSSMEKVLQATVLIDDMANYNGLNAAYKGRFGANPPARTTLVVAKGGLPGNSGKSLVEIDCIAYV
jgi:enamine deaminase RidA (YjgF/YER057c/UK114 family)